MRKFLLLIAFFGVLSTSKAQVLNEYKYVLVPETYEFTGDKDQYQLNSLTKFLLNKEGFNTLMTTEKKPVDLANNPCLGLTTRIKDNSGLFTTKLVIQLEDCYGNIVFTSKEGESRQKEYKAAYHEALREAFESVKELDYNYKPGAAVASKAKENISKAEQQEEAEAIVAKEVEIEGETEPEAEVKTDQSDSSRYSFEGQVYLVKEMGDRSGLFQQNSSDPVAILIPSDNGNYIYNSLTLQGVAYFDSEGNLIVEYFDSGKNEKVKRRYQLLDQ